MTEANQQLMCTTKKKLSLWLVFCFCSVCSITFFCILGTNSPIYKFNTDIDYNWFMTVGNALIHGKIPYRDLFEHKGPIVYFVTAFASLFPNPNLIILIIEIVSLSLFFFFAYRICRKYLNDLYALIAIPVLAFAIFTCWCRMFSAAAVEEFALPIYAYFLLCWLEFLTEKKSWNCTRSLCIGLCFGIILWVKFTLVYFMIAPMIIWLIISIRRRQFKTILFNALCMIAGVLIVSAPILLFYALHHAVDDLFYVYFYINLTAYRSSESMVIFKSIGVLFTIGPAILFLIFLGIIRFSILHWKEKTGWLFLISFLTTLTFLILTSKGLVYYYGSLFPYGILGVIYIVKWLTSKINFNNYYKILIFTLVCLGLTIPLSINTYEWGRSYNDYVPLAIAKTIHNEHNSSDDEIKIFCYKIWDFGFYNATDLTPNNYFFAKNVFDREHFPQMYESHESAITNQISDFVITELNIWEEEKDFLSQYYKPYHEDIQASTYNYRIVNHFFYKYYDFVLLKTI